MSTPGIVESSGPRANRCLRCTNTTGSTVYRKGHICPYRKSRTVVDSQRAPSLSMLDAAAHRMSPDVTDPPRIEPQLDVPALPGSGLPVPVRPGMFGPPLPPPDFGGSVYGLPADSDLHDWLSMDLVVLDPAVQNGYIVPDVTAEVPDSTSYGVSEFDLVDSDEFLQTLLSLAQNEPNHPNVDPVNNDVTYPNVNIPGPTDMSTLTIQYNATAASIVPTLASQGVLHGSQPEPANKLPVEVSEDSAVAAGSEDDTSSSDDEISGTTALMALRKRKKKTEKYVENNRKRAKTCSQRTSNIMKKIHSLDTVGQPFQFYYCSRPESVCTQNGKAKIFCSENLAQILGGRKVLDTFHDSVINAVQQRAQEGVLAARNVNIEVEVERRMRAEADLAAANLEIERLRTQTHNP